MTRALETLSAREVLGLAVHVERSNARRFRAFADIFRGYDDEVAARFQELAREEEEHETRLVWRFRQSFDGEIPAVDEKEIEGVIESADLDDGEDMLFDSLRKERVYELTLEAERAAKAFYQKAASRAEDPELAALYQELAEIEDGHEAWVLEKLRAVETKEGGQ